MQSDQMIKINETLAYIRGKTNLTPKVGITLGSGLASFADKLEKVAEISFDELPHFPPPTVDGHPGKLLFGHIGSTPVAIYQGRIHYYEGHSPEEVIFPTRVLNSLGIKKLILTNAAGGLLPAMQPGDFMILSDHINFMGFNPLRGANLDNLGPRFPDMTTTYTPSLRRKLADLMTNQGVNFHEGVYIGVSGPCYETPAEIKYFASIGGGAVGMSTVPEAIAARHMGMDVVGISCITNLAAGISKQELSHEEVKETGKMVETTFRQFLWNFVEEL